jgi:hypothetical protein
MMPRTSAARDAFTPYAAGDAASPAENRLAGNVRREIDWRLLLLGVMVVSAVYVAWHLGRGWVAHDEGTLGQSA